MKWHKRYKGNNLSYRRTYGIAKIIKVTSIYGNGKTQVPSEVLKDLALIKGESKLVWIREGGRYYVESDERRTSPS